LEWAIEQGCFTNYTLVTGLNYWFEPHEFKTELVSPQIARFQQYDSEEAKAAHRPASQAHYKQPEVLNYFWYPTPNATYWERNRFYADLVTGVRSWILPTEAMGNASHYQHNAGDTIHYQCGFNVKFPNHIADMSHLNTPRTVDCRDMFEFNIMQVMLNIFAMIDSTEGQATHGGSAHEVEDPMKKQMQVSQSTISASTVPIPAGHHFHHAETHS
jgi:hypothetical protein